MKKTSQLAKASLWLLQILNPVEVVKEVAKEIKSKKCGPSSK